MARPCNLCSGDLHLILEIKDLKLFLCDRCKKIWKLERKMMYDRTVYFQDFALALQIMGLNTGKRVE